MSDQPHGRATKRQAAEFLGVSEKAIERYANAGKLSKEVEKKEGGGVITYYDRAELQKLKQQMSAPTPRQQDARTPATAIARRGGIDDVAQIFLSAWRDAREERAAHKLTVELKDKEFLTIKEAAALKGLSETHINQAIRAGRLKARKLAGVRGRRIRRQDLDAYTKKL
jgi:excisionase family DNA binding protein